MRRPIDSITLKGFKSIRSLEAFGLEQVNVLIGGNGSGKSNFVSFFWLLRELVEQRLELAVNKAGGADAHLFLGPRMTQRIEAKLDFGLNGYDFVLEPTTDNRFVFADERIRYAPKETDHSIGRGHSESKLKEHIKKRRLHRVVGEFVEASISSWTVYHFHDTSETALMRRKGTVRDHERLRPDGANLAAFLFHLNRTAASTYELICDTIRLVAPFFDDFRFLPQGDGQGDELIDLEWAQKGSDYPFHPSQFSDGTLRFIALTTALLQPRPPATILIDEPELGLHPFALDVLANLILQAQTRAQIIVCTQSAALLNAFEPHQIVVIDRVAGESRFRRLNSNELGEWLHTEYTLGDLWQKNVYGGGPAHE